MASIGNDKLIKLLPLLALCCGRLSVNSRQESGEGDRSK